MEQSGLRVESAEGSNNFALGDNTNPDFAPTLAIVSAQTSNLGGEDMRNGDHNGPVDNAEELIS